jgi:hypothetical protein
LYQRHHPLFGKRLAEQIPLQLVASYAAKEFHLLRIFHPFGNGLYVYAVRHGDDRLGDSAFGSVARLSTNDLSIFNMLMGTSSDRKARVAGAKIVDGMEKPCAEQLRMLMISTLTMIRHLQRVPRISPESPTMQ